MPINPKQAIIKYRLVHLTRQSKSTMLNRVTILLLFFDKKDAYKKRNNHLFRHFLKSGLYFSFAIYALGSHFLCRVPGLGSVK